MTLKSQRIWVRIIGHMEMLGGRPFRAFGSVQNIQGKKLAQIALENSTGWLKLSMNMANMHAWRWDQEQYSFEFATLEDPQVHLPSGLSRHGNRAGAGAPQGSERRAARHRPGLLGRREVRQDFDMLGNDGRYRSYASTARPLFDGESPRGLVGVIQDITARQRIRARLRRSEELLRATTANTADTLILLDTALRVRFINKSAPA